MRYIIKQIVAATVVLLAMIALLVHEAINEWLFNGLGEWICILAPLGVVIISSFHIAKPEPKIRIRPRKDSQPTKKASPYVQHLSAQQAQRESNNKKRVIKYDYPERKQVAFDSGN